MINTCLGCLTPLWKQRAAEGMCQHCREELAELCVGHQFVLQGASALPVFSCGQYGGLLRRLVLRAKAAGDLRAYHFLVGLMAQHPVAERVLAEANVLVSAPSSLWSRVKGKFDLADGFTQALAKDHGIPMRSAPNSYHWRWRKQAHRRLAKKLMDFKPLKNEPSFVEPSLPEHHEAPVLVMVDDIITSGFTMKSLAASFSSYRLRVLTLAAAPRLVNI